MLDILKDYGKTLINAKQVAKVLGKSTLEYIVSVSVCVCVCVCVCMRLRIRVRA